MSEVVVPADRRIEFIREYAATGNCEYATRKAGFSDPAYGRALLRDPRVSEAVRIEVERQFSRHALPLALHTLTSIMRSATASNRDKLTAAKIVVDHVGSDPSATAEGKAPHEMTREEIIARIAQLEAERAERAIPINAAEEAGIFA